MQWSGQLVDVDICIYWTVLLVLMKGSYFFSYIYLCNSDREKGCGSACVVTSSLGRNVKKQDNSLSSISEIIGALFQATF